MAGKAFAVHHGATPQDLLYARAANKCEHGPLSESGHPDHPVLVKLTYDETTFNSERTFNGNPQSHIELAMIGFKQLADRLQNGGPVNDVGELGIPCAINTMDGHRRLPRAAQ
jgi:hypothetical protein